MTAIVKGTWWVGENLTNQNSLRIGNFFSNNAPSGYQAVQAGDTTDAIAFSKSLSTNSPTPNLHGISWQIRGGPYVTQDQAVKAIPGIQKTTPAPSALQQTPVASVTDFLSGFTSKNLWVRVAKVAVGGIILIVGLAKLTGAEKGIAGAAVKAAPLL